MVTFGLRLFTKSCQKAISQADNRSWDIPNSFILFHQGHSVKPAPEVYIAALEAIGVDARDALFVGDRVREDYHGPLALGMRAVICTAHAEEPPPHGIPTITSLSEVPGLL